MRLTDKLFGAMHYLETTFRNNEKTSLVERDMAYNLTRKRKRQEKVTVMSVALASAAQYFENEAILNGC